MPEFLSDPTPAVQLVLAAVAAGAAFYWFRTQTRRSVLVAGGIVAVVGLFFALAWLTESPREEVVRRIGEMIAAANDRKPAAVVPHLSDKFRYGSETKASFAAAPVWELAKQHNVRLATWDFDRGYVERPDPNTLALGFMLKVAADGGEGAFYVRPVFVHDADGAWRLQTFTLYADPLQKAKGSPFVLPGTH